MTLRRWLVRLGKNQLLAKVVRVEKSDESDRINQQRARIEQLERALGQTQAEKVLGEAFFTDRVRAPS